MTEEEAEEALSRVLQRVFAHHIPTRSAEAEKYYPKSEAAKYLGISESTLNRYIADRAIGFIKNGRLVLFKLSDLRAFLEGNRKKTRAEIAEEASVSRKGGKR